MPWIANNRRHQLTGKIRPPPDLVDESGEKVVVDQECDEDVNAFRTIFSQRWQPAVSKIVYESQLPKIRELLETAHALSNNQFILPVIPCSYPDVDLALQALRKELSNNSSAGSFLPTVAGLSDPLGEDDVIVIPDSDEEINREASTHLWVVDRAFPSLRALFSSLDQQVAEGRVSKHICDSLLFNSDRQEPPTSSPQTLLVFFRNVTQPHSVMMQLSEMLCSWAQRTGHGVCLLLHSSGSTRRLLYETRDGGSAGSQWAWLSDSVHIENIDCSSFSIAERKELVECIVAHIATDVECSVE